MKAVKPWQKGVLVKRYKRFLADIIDAEGQALTIHCPNTGSMRECISEGSPCWYSHSDSKTRKYPHTWEVATTPSGHWAGINTGRANHLVREALDAGLIEPLADYSQIQAEVKYGAEKSRIDFLLSGNGPDCYVEVKSVTLMEAPGEGLFPDAVSARGTKHLRELISMVEQGHRAVLLFCVQHTGIERVSPADHLDPAYGKTLREAAHAGVEVLAYGARIDPENSEIALDRALPVLL
ncbi:DNA/RNA nuclease SfsA [Gilvimarinus xylanilyticus]|uniref:Sugar fermentation stimulation protein homolog n=1 Tax=Gilvimarinus xylanilyticus TaxID=2944139 RepID=A0A9X2I2Q4_9GAMM|nr:DNA/RNA nuclease SfsA [Gilvimarinus xylanilyticus]MCP8899240.1 DNA/RNA nuclease SfsA [Gilvimarinus xylanilyticus]